MPDPRPPADPSADADPAPAPDPAPAARPAAAADPAVAGSPDGGGVVGGLRGAAPPRVTGHEVHRLLGAGASATVWAATDPRGEDVAIKVIDALEADEAVLREVSLLRAVDHPGVVRLRAVERTAAGPDGGRVALVLDRAHGGGLGALVAARGPLAVGEVVGLLVALADVLAALHARGLVHGDLSPGNVLFAADGAPLLADWGLSAVVAPLGAPPAVDGRLLSGTPVGRRNGGRTAAPAAAAGGAVEGTSGFADPSRSPGDPPGPAGDVRALAAVAWFALTGRPPGERADRLPLPVLVEAVPVELAVLLDRALSPLLSRRPTAAELAAACRGTELAAPVRLVATDPWACPGELMTHRLRAAAAAEVQRTADERAGVLRGRCRAVLAVLGGVGAAAALGTGAWSLAGELLGSPSPDREPVAAVAGAARGREDGDAAPGREDNGPAPATTGVGSASAAGVTSDTRAAPVAAGVGADEDDPVAAVAVLAQRRAAAFTAGEPSLLADVNAPGSAAAVVDAAALAALAASGVRVDGLSIEVTAAERIDTVASGEEVVVRAVVRTSAYRRTDAGGAVTTVAASGPVTSLLVLERTGGRWLLAGTR